jgi:uracil phosphoribosyltransferase
MAVSILTHPLIQHKLTILRDIDTGVKIFREVVGEMAMLMCYEAMRDLPLEEVQVMTPVAEARVMALAGKKLALVPILRAGLGMVDGILSLVPSAKVAHIGLYRDPETLEPVEYYCKMPPDIMDRDCFILDPMLATGGTAAAAAQFLKDAGARSIKLLTILSAPPGVEKMESMHPDVGIVTCGIDPQLNDHGYIVPGLGDAGDRIFGTK